jgi:hypothetical protein
MCATVHAEGLLDWFLLPACRWEVRWSFRYFNDVRCCEVRANDPSILIKFVGFAYVVASELVLGSSILIIRLY